MKTAEQQTITQPIEPGGAIHYESGHEDRTLTAAQVIAILKRVPPETPVAGYWDSFHWSIKSITLETPRHGAHVVVSIDVSSW